MAGSHRVRSPLTSPIAVIGLGATGTRVVESLLAGQSSSLAALGTPGEAAAVFVHDVRPERVQGVLADHPEAVACDRTGDGAGVVVLATPVGTHAEIAGRVIARGSSVVSLSDGIDDVRSLFALHDAAVESGASMAVGAGFAPGLTCLMARHAGDALDEVAEIAVAKAGTGGPACARQHHRAMKERAWDWFDAAWVERAGGSGRDLVWFPPPIGARDSYKGALPSPLLLQRRYPNANRIVARVTATRRDRFTSRLPMLRPPHPDGGPGAVRVEVRGRVEGRFETIIYAVAADPSRGAGVTGACVALAAASGQLPVGTFGLSELADPKPLLHGVIDAGLTISTFDGTNG